MCMNCKMYINFFIFLYLEKTTYFLIFYHSTPVYNFINDRLVDESAVLRSLS